MKGHYVWAGQDAARLCQEQDDVFCGMSVAEDRSTWFGWRAIPREF